MADWERQIKSRPEETNARSVVGERRGLGPGGVVKAREMPPEALAVEAALRWVTLQSSSASKGTLKGDGSRNIPRSLRHERGRGT